MVCLKENNPWKNNISLKKDTERVHKNYCQLKELKKFCAGLYHAPSLLFIRGTRYRAQKELCSNMLQKQPSRGVLKKRCFKKMSALSIKTYPICMIFWTVFFFKNILTSILKRNLTAIGLEPTTT